jgi:regulator of ribonuclease activity A
MKPIVPPEFKTADLCDAHSANLQVALPLLANFGALTAFQGEISTVQCFENNSLVRDALETAGDGRVLVVDGYGSLRCALIGDQLAALAERNGWAGIIVHGCVRDSEALAKTRIGIRALASHPRKSIKEGTGQRDVTVRFADVTFLPGEYLYADRDGIVISSKPLLD